MRQVAGDMPPELQLGMHQRDAIALIAPAVRGHEGPWADLGAGDGTFTRALVTIVGNEHHVYAVDRDPSAMRTLRNLARELPSVVPLEADVTGSSLPPLAAAANLTAPEIVATRPSRYQGTIYVAAMNRQ